MLLKISSLVVTLSVITTTTPVLGQQLPYNPTRLILSPDRSKVYQLSVGPSQASLSYFDISKPISSSDQPQSIDQVLPFSISQQALLPIADDGGITILLGNCQERSEQASLWKFAYNTDGTNGTWTEIKLGSTDTPLIANYLSAGFSFSADAVATDTSLYVFGGMCPSEQSNATTWTSEATYSNTMLSMSSSNNQSPYQLLVTGTRAPPIAEAGLAITPLSMIANKSPTGQVSQQQNFVLLGGHTQNAFINMSQVALFSLPEASWSFVGIDQVVGATSGSARRDVGVVEPRSGHTAVLTEDGSKIVVFGGWVGDISNPATPQLAVLELGSGYGGTGVWQWSVPTQTSSPLPSTQGLYGHGAVMLPGNIMMVSGGSSIGPSRRKRSTQTVSFYNTNTATWSTSYNHAVSSGTGGLDSSQKAGLGAGLGLGLSAIIAALLVWWLYRRRMHEKRAVRERHLRELAFGSDRHRSSSQEPSRPDHRFGSSEVRSASRGSRQDQQTGTAGFKFPWSGQPKQVEQVQESHDGPAGVERTGLEVPSPTRGLRKSLSTRGPASYGNNFVPPVTGSGAVFRIDEAEEESSIRSMRVNNESRMSDPFKDPPHLQPMSAAEERKREVQGWVEGWQSAAASMNLSRNPSQSRTYSNLSQAQSYSGSSSYKTGRESPEKSDRTGSNLSDRSGFSIQRSTGVLSRQMSQRSMSAGYTLFAGAAAAMRGLTGTNKDSLPARTASKRSISCNTGVPQRSASGTHPPSHGESRALLFDRSPTKSVSDEPMIKDYKNYARTSSLTSQRKRMDVLSSFKRVLTGTSHVDVQTQVEHYEEKSGESHPLPHPPDPEMSESANTTSAFWRGKKGAKDWIEDDNPDYQPTSTMTSTTSMQNKNRRSTIDAASSVGDYDGEDWDVETAVQQRVVQVMFTVPKEKLRVVNADALSLVSRSDVDEREERDRRTELKRMDSVQEDGDVERDPGPGEEHGDGQGDSGRKENRKDKQRAM